MTTENNPFQAPSARVEDVTNAAGGAFLAEGRRVAAGNGATWLSRGWEMFKMAPGPWIGIAVIFVILFRSVGCHFREEHRWRKLTLVADDHNLFCTCDRA